GGMTTFALLAWIAWVLSGAGARNARERSLFAAVLIGLILLACQIFLGGWTSSNYAALACGTDFPKCLGYWWPAVDFHQGFILWRGIGVNFEGGILDAAARWSCSSIWRGWRTRSGARDCAVSASRSARCWSRRSRSASAT